MGRFLFIVCLGLLLAISGVTLAENPHPDLVIVIVNHVGWGDLITANAPHLHQLVRESAVGLMNVKNYSGYLPASAFMTMSMSNRTRLDDRSFGAFNRYERIPLLGNVRGDQLFTQLTGESAQGLIVVPEIARYRRMARDIDPNAQPGKLGELLRTNKRRVAVYGNADILGQPHREAALLLMDSHGRIPYGDVGKGILRKDPKAPFGESTDGHGIIKKIRSNQEMPHVILVETGDTSRLEYQNELFDAAILKERRREAIEGLDPLIGGLMGIKPRYFILMAANVNTEMIRAGNTGLAPILLRGKGRGLLRSESTRRMGYVTNLDLLPTVATLLGIDTDATVKGFPMEVHPSAKGVAFLRTEENFYQSLRNVRYGITDTMVVLYLLTILLGFVGLWQGFSPKWSRVYQGGVLAMLLLPLGLMLGGLWGYTPLWPAVLTAVIFCGGVGTLLLRHIPLRRALILVSFIVPVLLLLDGVTGSRWMMRSPMGSDVIAGGRFYGIGNDLMGVILGSLITGIGLLGDDIKRWQKTARWWAPLLLLLATLGVGLPPFGANVGGMITALMGCVVTTLLLFDVKLSVRKMILSVMGVVAVVVLVASLDALFNSRPTHAGRAILALTNHGLAGFFQIVGIKSKILVNTIKNSAWTWLFGVEGLALLLVHGFYPKFRTDRSNQSAFWHKMMKPLAAMVFFALAVNDTGIIPAAIIISYYWFTALVLHFEASRRDEAQHSAASGVSV